MNKPMTLVLLSEPWHATLDLPEGVVVALDAEIDRLLDERGIAFVSGKDLRTRDLSFRDAAHQWAELVLENERYPFIRHRNVPLGHVYFYPLYLYFTRLAYWIDALALLVERYPHTRTLLVYPSSHQATETTGDLAQEEIEALIDAARLIGGQHDIRVEVAAVAVPVTPRGTFALKRQAFSVSLFVWNSLMGLRHSRPLRVLASDYWRNIGPLLGHMRVEVTLIDRLQALHAGFKNLWKYRIRLYHLEDFGTKKAAPIDMQTPDFVAQFRGYEVGPLLEAAHRALLRKYIPRALREVDGAYALMSHTKSNVIVLRVSTAPQTHYSVLAHVGRSLGIPSVELQHGLEYNGHDSFTRRKSAEYLGVYGEIIKKELIAAGIASERIEVIGSPRFDAHTPRPHVQKGPLKVLCIYPDLSYGDGFDTYDIDAYLESVVAALRGSEVHLTIKLRGARRASYFHRRITEICKDVPHTVAREESLTELFAQHDLVISCYSTVILEAMLCAVPLIFFSALPLEQRFAAAHLGPYEEAGALRTAYTPAELKEALSDLQPAAARAAQVACAQQFLHKAYAFDGKAAERGAQWLARLAK
jgi:hypothetical protein